MQKTITLCALLMLVATTAFGAVQTDTGVNKDPSGGSVDDTAYDATAWNGVTSVAPSKNAVRDKVETLVTGPASSTDGGVSCFDGTTGKLLKACTSVNVSAINLPSSDADPSTTAGQIRHDSTDTGSNSGGTVKWYDGAQVRSIVDTGTNYTIITKTEYIPIAYAEDGAAAPAAATVWADTRKAKIRVFAADADDDVEIHWVVPNDYVGGIKFRAIGFVDNDTAPADTETVIMNLAGCSVGDSDDGGCTLGTGVNATFTANATYAQHDRWSTAWSNEITVTDIAAGESVMLKLFRDVDDTYGKGIGVAGIEIKYKAKIIGIGGY